MGDDNIPHLEKNNADVLVNVAFTCIKRNGIVFENNIGRNNKYLCKLG